jgi:predicted N-acetyltransferase YhbS
LVKPAWSVRYLCEGDEPGLLELLQDAFGGWPDRERGCPPIDHLRWKLEGAEGLSGYPYVAATGEQIVGCVISVGRLVKIRERIVPVCIYGELAVHPDYQRQGMMRALWNWNRARVAESFVATLAISGHAAVQEESQRHETGFGVFANTMQELRLRPHDILHGVRPRLNVRPVTSFDDRADRLWEEASKPFDMIPSRTKDYLSRRYADARAGRFTISIEEDGGAMGGYCVSSTHGNHAVIEDLLALPGRTDVVEALLADAAARLANDGVDSIRLWSPARHPYRAVLERLGAKVRQDLSGLTMGRLDERCDMSFRNDPNAALHLTIGDLFLD